MKRTLIPLALLAALAALAALPGCTTLPGSLASGTSPAPLAQTTIDDRALDTTWKSFDLALDSINLLGDAGKIVPGTPKGIAVATAIRKVTAALVGAESFAAAGSSADYTIALREATAGFNELRKLIGSN
jgi:hypothetical protein